MHIEPFQMERWQSTHEHHVEINLSDSGVHPLSLSDLDLDSGDMDDLLRSPLIYTQTNGTPELRQAIATLHPGSTPENVEVVNGGAEANFIAIWSTIEPGDEVVVMLPNYMQVPGLVRGFGGVVTPWWMKPDWAGQRWTVDLDELASLVTSRTKLIALCNPNNPTGACLTATELDGIAQIADAHRAWVLCDEIYCGSELAGDETATIWGRTDRAIVTSSLSKSYGLPGLRLGWILAPESACADFWMHHDYTTIGPAAMSDAIAARVLQPARRARLLTRTRAHLRANYARVTRWLEARSCALRSIPPLAGAMLFAQCERPTTSTELAERLLEQKSVLIVPGDQYDMDGWIRIGFGGDPAEVESGLERVREVLER